MPPRAGTAYVEFQGDFSKLNKQVSSKLNGLSKQGQGFGRKFGSGLSTGIGAGAKVAAVGLGALTAEIIHATKGWSEHQAIARRSAAVIKSTGGAARVTAKHVGTLSDSIERQTGVDGDLVQSGANLLLTFTNVRNGVGKNNKIFDEATKTTVNMSKALGQDTKSSAIQLGKALNDPVKGISALSRVGVSFTEQQKEQIKQLVKSGDTMKAQKIILAELGKEFPKVKATPFERLVVVGRQVEDTIGKAVLPIFNKLVKTVTPSLQRVSDAFASIFDNKNLSFGEKIQALGAVIKREFGPLVDDAIQGIKDGHLDDKLKGIVTAATPKVTDAFRTVGTKAAEITWEGFKAAPLWAKVGGGAFLATKLGLTGPIFKGLSSLLTGKGTLLSKATPMPVFVTNLGGLPGAPGGKPPVVPTGAPKVPGVLGRAGSGALAAAPIIGAAALPMLLSPTRSDLGLLDQYAKNLQAVIKSGDPVKMQALADKLKAVGNANRDALGNSGPHLQAFAKLLEDTARGGGTNIAGLIAAFDKLPKTTGGDLNQVAAQLRAWHADAKTKLDLGPVLSDMSGTFSLMERQTQGHLHNIRTAVGTNMGLIKQRLGTDSEAGRKAMSENFRAAAREVKRSMDAGKISVSTGTAEIRRLMIKSLTSMGLTKEQAAAKLDTKTLQTDRGPGSGGGRRGAQRGRFIHGSGAGDRYPIMAEAGEYVLNREAVKKVGKGTLDRINYDQYPRFQTGGIVALGRELQREGYQVGEQSHFGGVHPVHVAGSYHYRDMALDVNADNFPGGEKSALDKLYARLKRMSGIVELLWQVKGHFDHLHVAMAGTGMLPGGMGALKQILPAVFGGSGFAQAAAQQGADINASAANSVLQGVFASLGGVEGAETGPGGTFSKAQLAALWKQAGGPPNVANVAAAIALAESGGIASRNNADRPGDGGRHIAAGLWQILGLPFEGNVYDPLTNAKMAVSKYKSAGGFSPWEAYTNGSYRSYQRGGLIGALMQAGGVASKPGAVLNVAKQLTTFPKSRRKGPNQDVQKRIAKHLKKIGLVAEQAKIDQYANNIVVDEDSQERADNLLTTALSKTIQDQLNAEMTRRGGTSDMKDSELEALFPASEQSQFVLDRLPQISGMNKYGWLNQELTDLFNQRVMLIGEPPVLDSMKKQVEAQIKALKQVIARVKKQIDAFVAARDKVKEKADAVHDKIVEEKRKKKPNQKHLDTWRDQYAYLTGDDIITADQARHNGLGDPPEGLNRWRGHRWFVDTLSQLRIDNKSREDNVKTMTTGTDDGDVSLANIKTATESVAETLKTIQGPAATMALGDFPLGTFSGTIGSVQKDIANFADNLPKASATETGPDKGQLAGTKFLTGLSDEFQKLSSLQRSIGLPLNVVSLLRSAPFGGAFATGGVVPGPAGSPRMILAHGGEVVVPVNGEGGDVIVQISGKDAWLGNLIDTHIERRTRAQSNRAGRLLPSAGRQR